jgi:DNA repair protein SbcD/Mre11
MVSFRFLHAADIHLDSPLHGLSRYDGLPAGEVRGATRAALDNLVRHAIDKRFDFVLIAGDLFDGNWRDMGTGLHFARAMGRLDQASIPVFLLAGNHDADSIVSRSVPWPRNVTRFNARSAETHTLPDLAVAIHGRSFATAAVTENLVLAYPEAVTGSFNIGMLHTALAGRQGHATYAPCSVDDLRAKRYDYWALGHVHEFEVVCTDPYAVFPGNIQGRTIRETGPKGAVAVTVEAGAVVAVERVELDVLRWTAVDVDCTGAAASEAADLLRPALEAAWAANESRLPLIARLTLVGETPDAGGFLDAAARLRDDARALAAAVSPDLHVEKLKVSLSQPAAAAPVGGELSALIAAAQGDQLLADLVAEDLDQFLRAARGSLDPPEADDLRAMADEARWPDLLASASAALRARLGREG